MVLGMGVFTNLLRRRMVRVLCVRLSCRRCQRTVVCGVLSFSFLTRRCLPAHQTGAGRPPVRQNSCSGSATRQGLAACRSAAAPEFKGSGDWPTASARHARRCCVRPSDAALRGWSVAPSWHGWPSDDARDEPQENGAKKCCFRPSRWQRGNDRQAGRLCCVVDCA